MNSTYSLDDGNSGISSSIKELAAIKYALDVSSIVAMTDARGVITYANDKFCELSKYSHDELIGNTHRILNSGYHSKEFFREMWATIASGEVWSGEVKNRAKDGSHYWVKTFIVPFMRNNKPYQYVSIRTDITEHKRDQELIRHIAYHDTLTGLFNRDSLQQSLKQSIERAKPDNRSVSILCIDLDRFKFVNDSLGHSYGDLLLKQAAERMLACIRPKDIASRLGGDEFMILLPDTYVEEAYQMAEKIVSRLSEPYQLEHYEASITASIGISAFPNDGEHPESLLKYADAAMLQAKQDNSNPVRTFSWEMRRDFEQTIDLEKGLREALAGGEFLLHYQPQYHSQTGRITTLEALVRWNRAGVGLVSPAEFIPVAESTGLIVPIGNWVMRTAFQQLKAWHEEGLPPVKIAINISGLQFQAQDFIEVVTALLRETGLDPQYVELELTESIAMQDEKHTLATLGELKRRGISIAMDDFGTGYSSLSYLKRLPLHTLKIDRSFIQDITSSEENLAIVRTIIELARILRMDVIAEGAETGEQVELLKLQGCFNVQGYYYSRPLPTDDMTELLKGAFKSDKN